MLTYFGACECHRLGSVLSGDPQTLRAMTKDELDELRRQNDLWLRPATPEQMGQHNRALVNAGLGTQP